MDALSKRNKKDGLYSELIVPDVSNKDEGGFFVTRMCIQATSQNLSLTESEDSVSIHALCASRRVFQTRREDVMGEREPLLLSRVQSTYCARKKLYHARSEGVDLHEKSIVKMVRRLSGHPLAMSAQMSKRKSLTWQDKARTWRNQCKVLFLRRQTRVSEKETETERCQHPRKSRIVH